MSDDKPTTPPEETPAAEDKAPETAAQAEEKPASEKKPLSDEEKAAKVAEAKARAAAKKAAEAAEPKDPWEVNRCRPTTRMPLTMRTQWPSMPRWRASCWRPTAMPAM